MSVGGRAASETDNGAASLLTTIRRLPLLNVIGVVILAATIIVLIPRVYERGPAYFAQILVFGVASERSTPSSRWVTRWCTASSS